MQVTRVRTVAVALAVAMVTAAPLPAAAAATAVRVVTHTLTPRIQRTVGFNGYSTYTFSAPRGRRIVTASARISGGSSRAVRISGRRVSANGTRLTVNLVFPGEQGRPGRLIVTRGTRA